MRHVSISLPTHTKPINPSKLSLAPKSLSTSNPTPPPPPTISFSHHKLTKFSIPSLLKNFASQQSLTNGKKTHAFILQMGLQHDPFIASSLINLYFKCHSPLHAHNLFAQLPQRDATLWNSIVCGYFHCRQPERALLSLRQMQLSNVRPDGHTLSILLKACSDSLLRLEHGKQTHGYIVRNWLEFDPFLATALIDMYSKRGDVEIGFKVFDRSVAKSVTMWNVMIVGFCRNRMWEKSLEIFVRMRLEGVILESSTLSSVLMACSISEAVDFGEGVHCCGVKMGFESHPYVYTSLVAMYGKFGLVDDAEIVYDGVLDKRRIELWNSMASAYINNGHVDKALGTYIQMRLSGVLPDSFTVSNMLSACSSTVDFVRFGRRIHGEVIKRSELVNITVQSSLITMYMKSGRIEDAVAIFTSTKNRDLVTWGSMIVGFCQNQNFDASLVLFNQLRDERLSPDAPIIASVASACTGLNCLEIGYLIHGYSIKVGIISDLFVASSIIDMYSKLGFPQLAGSIFSSLPYKNLAVLNSMISGYGRNGLLNESIGSFSEIFKLGLVPDSISITSVLSSVSSFAALRKGKMVHGYQIRKGIISDIQVENALLDMYMKGGCLRYARSIFERMLTRNVISWNTVISGYGSHGHCTKAIQLFEEMERSDKSADDATFLSLLSACSHSGLVEQGLEIFDSMKRDYVNIMPKMEHHANVVDLYSRAGRLNEAYSFIQAMPVAPDETIWLCLLSSCRAYRNLKLGEVAAEQLMMAKKGRKSGSCYSQVLKFYEEMGMPEKAASIRMEMKRALGMVKNPGCSWIEGKNTVHVFYSGDSCSLLGVDIHIVLKCLKNTMKICDHDFLCLLC